jgi:hypothetical protein
MWDELSELLLLLSHPAQDLVVDRARVAAIAAAGA